MFKIVEVGATVEPYGSFVSNLFTRWADLDISIELQNGSYISSPGRKHKQSLLLDVLRALRKKGNLLLITAKSSPLLNRLLARLVFLRIMISFLGCSLIFFQDLLDLLIWFLKFL